MAKTKKPLDIPETHLKWFEKIRSGEARLLVVYIDGKGEFAKVRIYVDVDGEIHYLTYTIAQILGKKVTDGNAIRLRKCYGHEVVGALFAVYQTLGWPQSESLKLAQEYFQL